MRLFFIQALVTIFPTVAYGQAENVSAYTYTIDLTRVVNDRIFVELSPPAINRDEITFYLPKIVPGTYSIADYGRYVTSLTAMDKKGKKLQVEKVDENSWKIRDARKLHKITYYVDDTWDTTVPGPEIFWPAGTNIEEGTNYVVNTSGFFGYFEGQKELPFEIRIVRDKTLYGSTGLLPLKSGVPPASLKIEKVNNPQTKAVDVFRTDDYDQLIDSPLMYARPDTAVITVANTEVLVGSYSPNGKISAKEIASSIKDLLMAQKEFLGGNLPVEKYAFLFYFTTEPVESYGALEHSYSSLYYIPENTIENLEQQLRDFAAHEFFHIITPLTVHSEEIEDFDFNKPKMSQHLWMYEGVTEYFAGLVQVKYNLIGINQFAGWLQQKMLISDEFINDVPFTDISKYTLDKYHDQYYNVYQKGALIGLCLDLKLRKFSDGAYGLQNLMLDLSKRYGKEKAFDDDELFEVITEMTYPGIGTFFDRFVRGSEKLPLQEVFHDVGIVYVEQDTVEDYSLGFGNENIDVMVDDDKIRLKLTGTENINEMGKALGLRDADVLLKINGETIPGDGPEIQRLMQRQMLSLPDLRELSYTVLRTDTTGTAREVELRAPVKKIREVIRHNLSPAEAPTAEQLALRQAWLRP